MTVSYRPTSNNYTAQTDTSRLAATSNNIITGEYNVISSAVSRSYLYRDNNSIVRVEYFTDPLPLVHIETFSKELELISSQSIYIDYLFTEWGGFFAGEKYNFLILGRRNLANNDDVEVIRILKYDKQWNQQGIASLYGANTAIPFFSTARYAEYNGMLYIHSGHGMYNGHQANMTLAVRQQDMKITDAQYEVTGTYGYVSHSFDQYILIDQEQNIITLDHGDGNPRASILQRYNGKAGNEIFSGYYYDGYLFTSTDSVVIQSFPGPSGENVTGAYLGGLAETSAGYITAYNYNGVGYVDDSSRYKIRNMYFSYTPKQNFSNAGTTITQVTSYPNAGIESAGKCKVVPIGLDGGYVLWDIQERIPAETWFDGVWSSNDRFISTGKISYIRYYSDGSISDVSTVTGDLSDCQPILFDSKIIWYVTSNSAPTFYVLDESGLMTYSTAGSNPFEDVEDTAYYYDAVIWANNNGITLGKTDTEFGPNDTVTRSQAVTFLWRAMGKPEPNNTNNPFYDVNERDYYYRAVLWAVEQGITTGTSATKFSPDDTCTHAHIVTFLWRAEGEPSKTGVGTWFDDAVSWANTEELFVSTSRVFVAESECPRADIVTYLYRCLG